MEKQKNIKKKVSSFEMQHYRGVRSFVATELFKFEMPLQFN